MLRHVRRIAVALVGGTVLTVGVAMVVLPGPAVLVIPAGLAILATEFPWARRLLHRVRRGLEQGLTLVKRRTAERHSSQSEDRSTVASESSRSSDLRRAS